MLEQERQRIEQLTAGWDDPTQVDWGAVETEQIDGVITEQTAPSGPVLKCTALYSYTVSYIKDNQPYVYFKDTCSIF